MTTPDERTRAVVEAGDFLKSLAYGPLSSTVPPHVRIQAEILFRHFPDKGDMLLASYGCPNWFGLPK